LAAQVVVFANETAKASSCTFEQAVPATIVDIDNFGVLTLSDKRRLKLADLFFPLNKEAGKISAETLLQMRQMVKGQATRILTSGPADRYGREPVFLYAQNTEGQPYLVQKALIRSGAAVYMPDPQLRKIFVSDCDVYQIKTELIAITPKELTFASGGRVGFAPILSANSQRLWSLEGEFVIVQGIVTDVRRTRRGISINFGDDWKEDFTAYFSSLVSKSFQDDEKLNSNLSGQKVQVRGFLDLYYGPSMRIDHLTQLEMLISCCLRGSQPFAL